MKITIDTKEDSHEEIKRVIELLNTLLNSTRSSSTRNIFEDNSSPAIGNPFASMFGADTPAGNNPENKEEEPKKQDFPEVEIY